MEHNIVLSKNRLESAKNYLVSKRIVPNLMLTEYFGDSKPMTTEKDKPGLQINRLAEIELVFD